MALRSLSINSLIFLGYGYPQYAFYSWGGGVLKIEAVMTEDSVRRRVQHLILNLAGLAAPLAGALVAVPILLSQLSPEAFSLLSMYWVIIGYASIFELGIGRSVTLQLAGLTSGDDNRARTVIGTAFLTAIALGLVAGFALFLALPLVFGHLIEVPRELLADNKRAIVWIACAAPVLVCTSVLNGVLEARSRFGWIAVGRVPTGLAMFLVPAILSLAGSRLPDLLLGIVIVRVILVLILAWQVDREFSAVLIPPKFELDHIGALLSFGGWLTISAIAGPLLVYLDRFILSAKHGLTATSYYTPPFEAVVRFLLIASAVVGVMFPRFVLAAKTDDGGKRRLFFEANAYVALGILPIALTFIFFGERLFSLWLGSTGLPSANIQQTAKIAAILAVGLFINGCAHIPQALIQAHGLARWTALLHIAELFCFLLYAPAIIAAYGLVGAAYSSILRSSISAVALYFLAARLLRTTDGARD
jgi:O-antigen/teichoic acid export membrane protein